MWVNIKENLKAGSVCTVLHVESMNSVRLTEGISSPETGLSCSQLNGQVLPVCNQLESMLQSNTDPCVDIHIHYSKFNGHLQTYRLNWYKPGFGWMVLHLPHLCCKITVCPRAQWPRAAWSQPVCGWSGREARSAPPLLLLLWMKRGWRPSAPPIAAAFCHPSCFL